jgi:hypothetical protein
MDALSSMLSLVLSKLARKSLLGSGVELREACPIEDGGLLTVVGV